MGGALQEDAVSKNPLENRTHYDEEPCTERDREKGKKRSSNLSHAVVYYNHPSIRDKRGGDGGVKLKKKGGGRPGLTRGGKCFSAM